MKQRQAEARYCSQCDDTTTRIVQNEADQSVCAICRSEVYADFESYQGELKSWAASNYNIAEEAVTRRLSRCGATTKGQAAAVLSTDHTHNTTPEDAADIERVWLETKGKPELLEMVAHEVGIEVPNQQNLSSIALSNIIIRLGLSLSRDVKPQKRKTIRMSLINGSSTKHFRKEELLSILLILRNQSV